MHCNFFVTADTEGSDGVAGLGVNGLLACKLFQHLKQKGKSSLLLIPLTSLSILLTLAARVNLSPDSPTQMFRQSLRILRSRIMFFALSLDAPVAGAAAVLF